MITPSSVAVALTEIAEPEQTLRRPPASGPVPSSSSSSAPGEAPARVIPFSRTQRLDRMAKLTDRDLVDRSRVGDVEAFGQLVRRHQPRIRRLALHMLRDHGDAEDVAQEAFIRAFRAIARFDGRSEPYTWFYRIAVNLSLNRIRARRSARATVADAGDPRLDAWLGEARADGSTDPRDDATRKELYAALCEGIDALSETLRTTLILVCIDGRTHEEASVILGAPEGTIAWRVHEARRKLRQSMGARGFGPEGEGSSGAP